MEVKICTIHGHWHDRESGALGSYEDTGSIVDRGPVEMEKGKCDRWRHGARDAAIWERDVNFDEDFLCPPHHSVHNGAPEKIISLSRFGIF